MGEIFLGIMELQDATNHQLALKRKGVDVVFRTHRETCTSGCKITVELWGQEQDSSTLESYFSHEQKRQLASLGANEELLKEVYDTSAEKVICQACGHEFTPEHTECPDCGLVYS